MSNIFSILPYTIKTASINFPITPGAYQINGGYGSIPIFGTTNLNDLGTSKMADSYLVMPGYSISVYNNYYSVGGTASVVSQVNNTNGQYCVVISVSPINTDVAVYLWYKGTPLPFSFTGNLAPTTMPPGTAGSVPTSFPPLPTNTS